MTNQLHIINGAGPTGLAVLKSLMSSAHQGIIVEDLNERIVALNSAVLEIFQLSTIDPSEFLGKSRIDFETRSSRAIISQPLPSVDEVKREHITFSDGMRFEKLSYPIVENDSLTGHIWVYENVGSNSDYKKSISRAAIQLDMASAAEHTGIQIWARTKLFQQLMKIDHQDYAQLVAVRIKEISELIEAIGSMKVARFLTILNRELVGFYGSESTYRVNHDEFLLLVSNDAAKSLEIDLERIRKAACMLDEISFDINIAVGSASWKNQASYSDIENALDQCRIALNASRHTNNYVRFSDAVNHAESRREEIVFALPQALRDKLLTINFQPIVNLKSGELLGYEGLSRWLHPTLGKVGPDEYIPIAAELSYLSELDKYNFSILPERSASLITNDEIGVGLNISASYLNPRAGLLGTIEECLQKYSGSPSQLIIELTESELVKDFELAMTTLTSIRELGVKIAIDDFGVGNSSLSLLQRIPFDYIKLDKSFAIGLTNPKTRSLVTAISKIAESFEASTVAEGIETQEQLEIMRDLNIVAGQGFLFGRAEPTS